MSEQMKAVVEFAESELKDSINIEEFKGAFRLYPGGVALVTTDSTGGPAAMTISSLTSVSAEPPVLMFSASKLSSSLEAFASAETVVIHMLSTEQLDLAKLGSTSGIDRFAELDRWTRLPSGEPLFFEAFAWLRGRVVGRVEVAGSIVSIVHVVEASIPQPGSERVDKPLVYHGRKWHQLGEESSL